MQSRRQFVLTGIATAGSLVIAGCNESSPGDSGNGNGNGNSGGGNGNGSNGDAGPQEIDSVDRTYTVQEDAYRGLEIKLPTDGRIEYTATVRSGPALDFYVMEKSEVTYLENGERFQYSSDASAPDSTGADVAVNLPAGNYAFVIDNTNAGAAQPPTNFDDDIAEVELTLTLYAL